MARTSTKTAATPNVSDEEVLQLLRKEAPSDEAAALIKAVRARLDVLEKEYASQETIALGIPSVQEITSTLREKIREGKERGYIEDEEVCLLTKKGCADSFMRCRIEIDNKDQVRAVLESFEDIPFSDSKEKRVNEEKRVNAAIAKSGIEFSKDDHFMRQLEFGPYPLSMPRLASTLATLIHKKFKEIEGNLL